MEKFIIGKSYSCRSIGDHDCVFEYTVLSRTDKTVTISGDCIERKPRRRKIYTDQNGEYILPLGDYSFAPVLRSDRVL